MYYSDASFSSYFLSAKLFSDVQELVVVWKLEYLDGWKFDSDQFRNYTAPAIPKLFIEFPTSLITYGVCSVS